ncbi:hypothetical protein GCM10023189_21740 [Nibrella saemangeumensis]|uniref:Uncharacterized protein n=2 Tax=Nibrella saemangeumensis TaxID=1084526 RepID=A0ABP8MR98_9BACT
MVVVASFLAVGPVSKAGKFDGCEASLNLLLYTTQQSASLSTTDKTTLSRALRGALDAYGQGNTSDAVQKLNDYQGWLNQFYYTPTPRINAMDYLRLNATLGTTRNCLQPQTPQQPSQQVPQDTVKQ